MNAHARAARIVPEEASPRDAERGRIGEKAFDVLLAEVCGPRLKPKETLKALGLMVRLTEEFCADRKGDLLSLASALARRESAHRDVRAAAARIAATLGGRMVTAVDRAPVHGPVRYGASPRSTVVRSSPENEEK